MHKSRLAGFIIDCQTDDADELKQAAEFWSQALGYNIRPADPTDPTEENYILLDTDPDEVHIELQKVAHPSRVHLDIEADDIDAEAERLEQLGAQRIEKIHTWWVMQAPSGQRFCIVRPQRADFEQKANQWGKHS